MRVLHVIPAVARRYGGPSRAVFEMSRALSACGTDVLIATTNADGPGRLNVNLGETFSFNGADTIFFPQRVSERFSYSSELAQWLRINVGGFDLVHIHAVFSHPCLAAARACRKSGVPYIVRPLGSLDPWSMSQKPLRKVLMWHAGIKRMLETAAAIHYTTIEEKRLAESTLGLSNGVVIPLGIDSESGSKSNSEQSYAEFRIKPYILFLGRIHPKKNLESLIKAFGALNESQFQTWRLVVAGDGESGYVARLKHLAAETGANGRITFPGWVSGQQKSSILKGAALLALPSYQENFGICVAEALASGVPVVISRHVNLAPDIEDAHAGWVTGLEYSEIKVTLAEAMKDDAERNLRGQAGLEFVACRLGWPHVAKELIALYQTVLNNSAATFPLASPSH